MFVHVVIPRPFATFLPLGTVDSHCLGSQTCTLVGSWTRRNRTNQSVFQSARTYLHSLTTSTSNTSSTTPLDYFMYRAMINCHLIWSTSMPCYSKNFLT